MRKLLFTLIVTILCCMQLLAQTRTIIGKVMDTDGSPIPNASVIIKGTSIAASTDANGGFSLSLPYNAGDLVVSSAGYITQELYLSTGTTAFNISLKKIREMVLDTAVMVLDTARTQLDTAEIVFDEAEAVIDEVIVPYKAVKRRTFTGFYGEIKADRLNNRPITNITSVIEGLTPGVITTTANGQPGSGPEMRVRGFGTINASPEPLIVVDGIPYVGDISNINPADVENLTVLKDAASMALYGSRAGNGVIMITTKKGRNGDNNISVRVMQGLVTRAVPEYDRLNASQYYPIMWEAYRNSLVYPGSGTGISVDSANRVASGLTGRTHIYDLLSYNPFNVANNAIVGTGGQLNPAAQLLYADDLDWTKELFRTGPRGDYSVNYNGGSEKSNYLLSLGYVKENGYLRNSDFQRYSARLNVNVQPKTWLKAGLNIFANSSESNTAQDSGSTSLVNPFNFTRNIGPIYPVYAHNPTTGEYLIDPATGQRFYDLGNMGGAMGVPNRTGGAFAGRHALAETILNQKFFRRTSASARNYQEITFLNDFRFTNNLSADYQVQNNSSYDNPLVGEGAPQGRSRQETVSNLAFVASQLLNYAKTFDVHTVDVLVGHESFSHRISNVNSFKQGQTVSGNVQLGNFSTINSTGSSEDRYNIESYFSRLNYDLNEKYFISASIRRDGNSAFAPSSRWGTFWSVGAGWNLSGENFLSNIKWIDNIRLRGSYGTVGVSTGNGTTSSIGLYAYQGLYNFSNNANEPGIVQSQTQPLFSREITWEKNKHLNLGVDLNLFKDRIALSVNYFERASSDLLFAVPQALSTGVLSIIQNAAAMENTGIELSLGADIIRSKYFTWNTVANLATMNNKITKMPAAVPEFITGTKKYSEGQSLFEYWLPTYYGVDPADGAALYKASNTAPSANRRILDNKIGGKDTLTLLASNGKVEYQGTSIPDFFGSFSQSLSYKGLSLTAMITFQFGGKTYEANYQGLMSSGTYGAALSTDVLNRWQKAGDITDIPRMDQGRTTDFNAASSRWLVDASYLNIRSVSLAYSLPESFISRLNLTRLQVFVSGENLGFFSKRKGLNNQQHFSGVTTNSYSPARVISAGLNLNL